MDANYRRYSSNMDTNPRHICVITDVIYQKLLQKVCGVNLEVIHLNDVPYVLERNNVERN